MYGPEAVDRTMRDVRDDEHLFGGVTVVFGSDFQQILPVIPGGGREQIVCHTIGTENKHALGGELREPSTCRMAAQCGARQKLA